METAIYFELCIDIEGYSQTTKKNGIKNFTLFGMVFLSSTFNDFRVHHLKYCS